MAAVRVVLLDYPPGGALMHPQDLRMLSALLGELMVQARRLESDGDLRGEWANGKPLRFPISVSALPEIAQGYPFGLWVELRVIDPSEVVDGALSDRENRG